MIALLEGKRVTFACARYLVQKTFIGVQRHEDETDSENPLPIRLFGIKRRCVDWQPSH